MSFWGNNSPAAKKPRPPVTLQLSKKRGNSIRIWIASTCRAAVGMNRPWRRAPACRSPTNLLRANSSDGWRANVKAKGRVVSGPALGNVEIPQSLRQQLDKADAVSRIAAEEDAV